jgi:hypothetical protein
VDPLAGKRSRRKKKKANAGRRAMKLFYRTLVIISAVIVTTFVVWNLTIRPPAVEAPPIPTQDAKPPVDDPDTPDIDESQTTPAVGQTLNRKDRYYTFLLAAGDQVSGNADTIMIASYDVPNQKVSLVSIPRDTLVDRTHGKNHYYKINGAYAFGGIDELKEAVTEMLGIPIDFYVTVDLKAFVEVVDAVGGVDFYVPIDMNYDAPDQDLHIHYNQGQHTGLTGQQVLEIARCRKNSVWYDAVNYDVYDAYAGSGTNREETQRGLMVAIAKKLLSWGSLTKINSFVDILQRNVKTNLSGTDMAYFASQAVAFKMDTGMSTAIFPGAGDVTYKGNKWCWEYDREASLEIINTMLNPYTTDVTPDMTHMVQAN